MLIEQGDSIVLLANSNLEEQINIKQHKIIMLELYKF
tara:strand:- start:1750 stop:1860 length:111 start_codon:yes stop_codon:yes gene_type:complete